MMEIYKITKKIKCDINGCKNLSEYNFVLNKGFRGLGLNLCKNCVNDMFATIGKYIVPKSPVNMLNIDKKKEKKLEIKK